jgi:outer membrane receptor protein involved in Fe transport
VRHLSVFAAAPAALWLLTLGLPARADEPDPAAAGRPSPDTPQFRDEVTVTATREARLKRETPATVDILSRETLAEVKPAHPSQIMGRVPGVWVSTTGGEGHMTAIRQPLTTNPVYLYLEDGVPTRSTGFFNHNALYEVNLPQAEGIEVTKGPGSALHGSDAIGGVVNVVTRSAFGPPGVEASLEGGSYGFWRGLVSLNAGGARDAVRGDLNLTHTDGWREATGYDRQAGSLRWDRAGEAWAFKTLATFGAIDQQTAGTSTLPEEDYLRNPTSNLTPISLRDVTAFRLSTEARYLSGPTLVTAIPYFRYDSMDLLPNWTLTFDPTIYDTKNTSYGLLAKVRRDLARMRAQLVAGVDLDLSPGGRVENQVQTTTTRTPTGRTVYSGYTLGPLIYDYDARYLAVSPYAQISLAPTARLRVDLGLRYDHLGYRYDDQLETPPSPRYQRPADASPGYDHLSPKLGLTYQLSDSLNAFLSYRNAFRAPSEGQLFRQGTALDTIGLKPVKADNYEVGLRVTPAKRAFLEVSLYRLDMHDDILSYRDPVDGSTQAVNAGKTRHDGVEVGLNLSPWGWLEIAGAYSYAEHTYVSWVVDPARGVDYSGNDQEVAPNRIANVAVSLNHRRGTLSFELFHVGPYWMDAANTQRYEGHTLLSLRGRVRAGKGVAAFARVLNLADERYAESSSYTLQRGRELAPGMPRTFYAGLEVDWRR